MTRARELSKLGNINALSVDSSNNVGVGSTSPDAKLDVVGIVSATYFYGDGSNITNAGSSLSASSGSQRVVVTSLTSGTMTSAGTDGDLTWNSSTNTLSATNFAGDGSNLSGIDATTIKDSGGVVRVQGNTSGIVVSGITSGLNVAGVLTAATGSFSGNLTVGGVLTYEDVTNVDSVGIITAQSGIRVGASQSISPVSGTITYYGDGSHLDGVESGVVNFVASGTIANGATVIIKDDGTVGIVTVTGSLDPSVGSEVLFNSAATMYTSSTYDSNSGKVVIAYQDDGNSDYGTAVVGTVSGTSISFGSEVVFESAGTTHISCTYDSSSEKVVIAYCGNNDSNGEAIVGTVSGTSISFGTAVQYESGGTSYNSIVYDSTNQKVVIAYHDRGNSDHGTAIVGTVSGTSISFGTAVVFESAKTDFTSATYDSDDGKVVIAYNDDANSDYGTAIVGTVSGTSISFGSAAVFNSGTTESISSAYDSTNQKVVIVYSDLSNSSYGTAIVGTVSGTAISFGSEVVFNSGSTEQISSAYDSANGKVDIAYRDAGNSSYGTAIVGTVSGTAISFGSEVVFNNTGATNHTSSTYDSANGKVVIAYRDDSNANQGTSVVFSTTQQTTNLTTENYIGIAGESISNAATGKVNVVGGVNSGQSGLTTAKTYYVAPTGILTTTAGNPSVVAGTSISDTKIIVWRS